MKKNIANTKPLLALLAALGLMVVTACGGGSRCPHAPLAQLDPEAKTILIKDVRVFSGLDTKTAEHQDVLVANGKIEWIRATGQAAPTGAKVLDFAGKDMTLLPGFIDSHVHLTASGAVPWAPVKADIRQNAATMLDAGITTVYDLGGVSSKLEAAKKKINTGKWQGPQILHTHSPITTPGGHPIPAIQALLPKAAGKLVAKLIPQVGDPAQAAAVVEKTLQQHVDFVKVICDSFSPGYPEMSDAVLMALVKESHDRNQKVFVHVASAQNVLSAIEAKADILAHGPYRSHLTPAQAKAIGSSGIPMIYTLAACHGVSEMMQGKFEPDEYDRQNNGACLLDPVKGSKGQQFSTLPVLGGFGAEVLENADFQSENIQMLHAAGQRFLVGTDSPIPGAYAGSGFHHEMEELNEAGVPAGEVLLGATGWAAKALYNDPDFGTIEPGKRADLVLVAGNPIQDLRQARKIAYVLQSGRLYAMPAFE